MATAMQGVGGGDAFFDFPPFFTLQPVEATRTKQLQLWRQVVLKFFAERPADGNVLILESFAAFENNKIGRKLNAEGRIAVANDLILSGHGEWQVENKTLSVFVKTPSEWATIIYEFITSNGLGGTIYTLYELHSGDLTRSTQIQGIDPAVCIKALEVLSTGGKAQVFHNEESLDETGVKFI